METQGERGSEGCKMCESRMREGTGVGIRTRGIDEGILRVGMENMISTGR